MFDTFGKMELNPVTTYASSSTQVEHPPLNKANIIEDALDNRQWRKCFN